MKDSVRKEILDQLISLDEAIVNKALDKIRKKGDHTFIGPLLHRLTSDDNTMVQAMIIKLFQDLNDVPSMELLIDGLTEERLDTVRPQLLEAVWQSGLDIRHKLDNIVDISLKGDYIVCLECLTIIENMEPGIDAELLERNIKKLKDAMMDEADTSDDLRLSTIEVLENFRS